MATATKFSTVINGVMIDDLMATVDAIKEKPSIAKFNFRIHNQWEGCGQNYSDVSGYYGAGQEQKHEQSFVLEADEPRLLLGKDTAPNPAEYLLHALASCMTTAMVYQAAARGIQIEEVESSLEADVDLRGFLDLDKSVRKGYQGIRVQFKIKADVSDEQLQAIAQLAPTYSATFDSLTNGVPVSVTAERL
jgi:uncharacterized OsmC-like protein